MLMQFSSTQSTSDLLDKNPRAEQCDYCPQAELENCNGYAIRSRLLMQNLEKKERNVPLLLLMAIPHSSAREFISNTSRDPEVGKLV
jgi:hypothetical protein